MPYNYKGDLYKREIVKKLQNMGLDVKSVNALNKIMEKMGLLIHYGNGWGTTDAGAKFSMWHKGVLNSDSWHPELVDEIAKFLKKKIAEKCLTAGFKASREAFVRLCLSFDIDLKNGFQFNCAMVVPYCDLLKPAFYKGLIKFFKVGRLVFYEILQFCDSL